MRCPLCNQTIYADYIEHLRTSCSKKRQKKVKTKAQNKGQYSLWPSKKKK